jgi:hypothetical protein
MEANPIAISGTEEDVGWEARTEVCTFPGDLDEESIEGVDVRGREGSDA